MAQPDATRAHAALRQSAVDSAPASGESAVLADSRATTSAQRRTAQAIAGSPRTAAESAAATAVHASPRMAAQRRQLGRMLGGVAQREAPAPPNRTGLPDTLKSGVESLSGMSLDHVRVHYNSSQPAQLNALAYAQGSDIHLGPGQEKHLPHEAWHVVQQAQGRVAPTMQMKSGVPVNDDAGLEREADAMGARAMQLYGTSYAGIPLQRKAAPAGSGVVQRLVGFEFETNWDLRRTGGPAWNTDTALVRGKNWQLSPDEISGNNAKIEFKTGAFDVDGNNVEALAQPIADTFASMTTYIQSSLEPLAEGVFSPLPTMMTAGKQVQVQPVGDVEAKPQTTGGVRLDLILRLMRDMARDDKETDLMPGANKKALLRATLENVNGKVDEGSRSSREYWGVVALLGNLVRRFQDDKTQALREYEEWRVAKVEEFRLEYQQWSEAAERTPQAEQVKQQEIKDRFALAKTAKQLEIRTRLTPSYAKARASALPRVAFNELPRVTRDTLLADVLSAAGLGPDDGALRMFPLGLKTAPGLAETIAQWITSIQQPLGGGEGELWSSRSLGTGLVGPPGTSRRRTGIPFELRGIPGPLPYAEWPQFAVPFIGYYSQLNYRRR